MRPTTIQVLTFVMCLTLGGGGGARACLCWVQSFAAPVEATAHGCCQPSEKLPAPSERCHECDVVAAVPKAAVLVAAPTVLLPATSSTALPVSVATRSQSVVADGLLIPPLLRDLHHLFTQLTE